MVFLFTLHLEQLQNHVESLHWHCAANFRADYRLRAVILVSVTPLVVRVSLRAIAHVLPLLFIILFLAHVQDKLHLFIFPLWHHVHVRIVVHHNKAPIFTRVIGMC